MRRVFLFVIGVTAAVAVLAGPATGATSRCGTLYTPACTPPHVTGVISAVCRPAGTRLHPSTTVTSNAGIRRITVTFRGHTLASRHFSGQGPTRATVRFTVNTTGLRPGVYTIRVSVLDVVGKRATKTLRFAICKPVPHFTG
jgi:hypothetical protein